MRFEQMQVIWDSQNERQVLALDMEGLHSLVQRRSRGYSLSLNIQDLLIVFACSLGPALNGYFSGQYVHETIGAAIHLGIIAYVLRLRLRRRGREAAFAATLLGDLDRAIFRSECLAWWARNFGWWFMLPTALNALISLIHHFSWSAFLTTLTVYSLGLWAVRLTWKRLHRPEVERLQSLRARLGEEN